MVSFVIISSSPFGLILYFTTIFSVNENNMIDHFVFYFLKYFSFFTSSLLTILVFQALFGTTWGTNVASIRFRTARMVFSLSLYRSSTNLFWGLLLPSRVFRMHLPCQWLPNHVLVISWWFLYAELVPSAQAILSTNRCNLQRNILKLHKVMIGE
jgi:hypothetical protein